MTKALVIVESPTKARTIGRFLDDKAEVLSSMGHIRDLPESSLGVDVAHGFKPTYVMTRNGKKVMRALREAVAEVDRVYLATDPDREGEAIAWHLQQILEPHSDAEFSRVTFHEITRTAIEESFKHAGVLDTKKVDAQQARRVLDRIVGYQVSPLLWKNIQRGTSAGRVQSVALRLVCVRERAIQSFEPVEYWNLEAEFVLGDAGGGFTARLTLLDGKKPVIPNAESANALADELTTATFAVTKTSKTPRKRSAPPPFVTSTLQQAAGSALRFGTSQTMRIAQQLYEGIELGDGEAAGLITYMRTDSVSIAKEARNQAREYIGERFGAEYVPKKPNVFRSRKNAQEAHEAIRPTDVRRTPEQVASHLTSSQLRLYRLIWNRFVASQMAAAQIMEHTVDVGAQGDALSHAYVFRASARQTTFPGYLVVYDVKEADQEEEEPASSQLPEPAPGMPCALVELDRQQRFTEPPKRFSEATLVRELEQNGIGRPSTYATIVNTIQERDYVLRQKGRLVPSELGFKVNDFLVSQLPALLEVDFTAQMESRLDAVEDGDTEWTVMLGEFYGSFQSWVSEGLAIVAAPAADRIAYFMEIFPDDLAWNPPTKRGRRTYDDAQFFASLRQQLSDGKRVFSDRQWLALLALAARYADRIPGLLERAEELGVREKLEELAAAAREPVAQREEPDPRDKELIDALSSVKWAAPVKRGRRTFSDRRFYRSLKRQVEDGSKLSDAQVQALRRIVVKYGNQIPTFEDLTERFGLETPAEAPESHRKEVTALLALLDQVKEWAEPRKRGSRVYDDRQFAESVREQFGQRGSLSTKQVSAIKRVLGRYRDQIADYDDVAEELGLRGTDKAAATPLDTPCPKCGAPLVTRSSRGREFIGCSAFPKCRFAANELPGAAAKGES